MYYLEELTVKQLIVHILDHSLTMPVLSMEPMPISEEVNEFFSQHLIKTMNDDSIKTCIFNDEHNLFHAYLEDYIQKEDKFVDFSIQAANQLFSFMTAHAEIPSGDLAIIEFYYAGVKYLGIFKLNYQNTYIHFTDYENAVNVNTIVKHQTTLPNINQRIGEAIIINLSNQEIRLLEKPVEIDGKKEHYLSTYFLQCSTKLSSKDQYKIVKKATDSISKKYFDEDIEKKMTIKQELYNSIEEDGGIDLEKYAEEVFETNIDVRNEFIEEISKKGLQEPKVKLEEKTINRSFTKQKIKTDNGIEIHIPMELYNNPSNMEFITNPDGKISIVLKNIGKIIG